MNEDDMPDVLKLLFQLVGATTMGCDVGGASSGMSDWAAAIAAPSTRRVSLGAIRASRVSRSQRRARTVPRGSSHCKYLTSSKIRTAKMCEVLFRPTPLTQSRFYHASQLRQENNCFTGAITFLISSVKSCHSTAASYLPRHHGTLAARPSRGRAEKGVRRTGLLYDLDKRRSLRPAARSAG